MLIEKLIMRFLPLWYFFLLYFGYAYGKLDPIMLNKIAGLLALMLIATAFLIGSLSYFFSSVFTPIKHYRKYIGIWGFAVALAHTVLSFVFFYNTDIVYMFSSQNEHLIAVYFGLTALFYFLLMTITSNTKAMQMLGSHKWKLLQTGGYVALLFVMLHFIFAETNHGVFNIKRLLGRIIFIIGFFAIAARLLVVILQWFTKKQDENNSSL